MPKLLKTVIHLYLFLINLINFLKKYINRVILNFEETKSVFFV